MSAQISPARKILFVAFTAILLIVTLEIFLQVFYFVTVGDFLFRRALPPIYEADAIRCYRVKANLDYVHRTNEFEIHLYTNSLGMRTGSDHREISETKPEDVYRILITGPSFAFGWGSEYEDIFATLIERGLKIPGKRIEVMNLGTPSQGPAQQLCWLKEIGYRYRPDMVLHVAYGRVVPSRPSDCPADLECPGVEEGQLVPLDLGVFGHAKAFMKRFGLVFYGYYAYETIFRPAPPPDASKSLHGGSSASSDLDSNVESIAQSYVDYRKFVRTVLGPNTTVAFLFLPYSYLVHTDDVGRFADVHASDIPVDRRQISETIDAIGRRDIPILDTLPPLLAAAKNGRLYYWLDIHFTPMGNHVVAEAAIPFLHDLIVDHENPTLGSGH